MTAEISQEAIDRMVALVRQMAAELRCGSWSSVGVSSPAYHEAAEIVALLPEPIDPDKAIMREIVNRHLAACSYGTDAMFMELLNRGRELAKARAGEGSV